jgi:hypothetical protein
MRPHPTLIIIALLMTTAAATAQEYPRLSAPNDGYDENDRWLGMTPEEVVKWLERVHCEVVVSTWRPEKWKPPNPDRPH